MLLSDDLFVFLTDLKSLHNNKRIILFYSCNWSQVCKTIVKPLVVWLSLQRLTSVSDCLLEARQLPVMLTGTSTSQQCFDGGRVRIALFAGPGLRGRQWEAVREHLRCGAAVLSRCGRRTSTQELLPDFKGAFFFLGEFWEDGSEGSTLDHDQSQYLLYR